MNLLRVLCLCWIPVSSLAKDHVGLHERVRTVENEPPERWPATALEMDGFSATHRTFMARGLRADKHRRVKCMELSNRDSRLSFHTWTSTRRFWVTNQREFLQLPFCEASRYARTAADDGAVPRQLHVRNSVTRDGIRSDRTRELNMSRDFTGARQSCTIAPPELHPMVPA